MLPHIASRLYGTPLLMHPQKAEVIAWALQQRMGEGFETPDPTPEANRFMGSFRRDTRDGSLVRAQRGVAIVSVLGSLVNRGAWIGSYSGMTSYEGLTAQIADIENDKEIHSVIFDIDTPGGEAGGGFTLAERVRNLRQSKRVVAVVNDVAASGGYLIASAADEIVVSTTSMLGSIGVVVLHLDRSGELSQKGIKATLIYAGAHKVDQNPFGPLSADAAAEAQQRVMTIYDRFVEAVEAGRGPRMTAKMARATEARVFIGTDAVKAGLADRVATFEQVVAELSNSPTRPTGRVNTGGPRMSGQNDNPQAGMVAQADHDKAVADARAAGHAEGKAEGVKEGVAKGAADTVARFDAVMSLEEAKGREPQAIALFKAGLSADQAKPVLAAAPKGSSLEGRIEAEHAATVGAPTAPAAPGAQAASGWGKAVAQANARFGSAQ